SRHGGIPGGQGEPVHRAAAATQGRRMRGLALGALVLVVVGCGIAPYRPALRLIDRGDALMEQGDYRAAAATYNEGGTQYPGDRLAASAMVRRDAAAAIRAAREEIARLRADLTARESEVTRLRQEIDRLRADLETIKQTDLQLERKR